MPENNFDTKQLDWILKALSSEIRRKIIELLYRSDKASYTDLLEKLEISTGKLNFHLRQLNGLIEKTDERYYTLTNIGKRAIMFIQQLFTLSDTRNVKLLNIRGLSLYSFAPAVELKKKQQMIGLVIIGLAFIVQVVLLIINPISKSLDKSNVNILIGTTTVTFVSILITFYFIDKYYNSIYYELSETEITISKGILTKSKVVIPYRTITNIIVREGLLDRLYGITTLIIETAGESGTQAPEGKLEGIYYPDEITEEILNRIRMLDPPKYVRSLLVNNDLLRKDLLIEIRETLNNIDKKLTT